MSEVMFEDTAGLRLRACMLVSLFLDGRVAVFVCARVFQSGPGQRASTALHHTTTKNKQTAASHEGEES